MNSVYQSKLEVKNLPERLENFFNSSVEKYNE